MWFRCMTRVCGDRERLHVCIALYYAMMNRVQNQARPCGHTPDFTLCCCCSPWITPCHLGHDSNHLSPISIYPHLIHYPVLCCIPPLCRFLPARLSHTLIPTRPSRMITLLLLLLLHSSRACQTIRITFQSRLLQLLSRHGRVRIRQLVPGGGRSGCNGGVGKLGSVFFESGVKGVLEVCSGSGHGGGFGLGIGVQVVDCGLQGRRSRVRTLVLLREKGE